MNPDSFAQLMTILTVIGTGVGTVLLQVYREGRARRWLEADRKADREEARETAWHLEEQVRLKAETLALTVETERVRVEMALVQAMHEEERQRRITRKQMRGVTAGLSKAEHAAEEAYKVGAEAVKVGHEAIEVGNNVNKKIADLNKRLLDSSEQARTTGEETLAAVLAQESHGDEVTRNVQEMAADIRAEVLDEKKKRADDTLIAVTKDVRTITHDIHQEVVDAKKPGDETLREVAETIRDEVVDEDEKKKP